MKEEQLIGKEEFWGGLIDDDNCLWIEEWHRVSGDNKKLVYAVIDEVAFFKQDNNAKWCLEDIEFEPFGRHEEDLSLDTMVDDLVNMDMVYALTLEDLLEELKEKVLHDYLLASRHLDQLGVIEYYIKTRIEEGNDAQ